MIETDILSTDDTDCSLLARMSVGTQGSRLESALDRLSYSSTTYMALFQDFESELLKRWNWSPDLSNFL